MDSSPPLDYERHTWLVLGVSAALGFAVGAFVHPMWMDNVESAQVIANLVVYPPGNVMRAYHTSVYSLLIQAAAILLRAGVSEWTLSVCFSGLQGALACSSLALVTLAVSRSLTTALALPVLMLRFREAIPDTAFDYLATFHGHHYPNLFPNHAGIYGVVGLFWILLVFGLFSLRKVRTASTLLGLMPAIHPGLAPALVVGVLANVVFLRHTLRSWLPTVVRYGAIGIGVFLVTASWQLFFLWDVPSDVPRQEIARIAEAFVVHWDDHNALLGSGDWVGYFESEYYTLLLSVSLLTFLRHYLSAPARIVVVALLAITIVAIAYAVALNLFPGAFSWQLRSLMLRRWLNLSSFGFVVLAFGLLGQLAFVHRDRWAALAFGAVVALVLSGRPSAITCAAAFAMSDQDTDRLLDGLTFPLVLVLSPLLIAWLRLRKPRPSYAAAWTPVLSTLVFGALAWSLYANQWSRIDTAQLRGEDRNSAVLARVRQHPVLLLVGDGPAIWDIGRIQLRTRRPLLLDPTQLNLLLKVPSVGRQMAWILNRVYGARITDGIPGLLDEGWSGFDRERWGAIRREFHVTEVLVRKDLPLHLELVADSETLALYSIPEQ